MAPAPLLVAALIFAVLTAPTASAAATDTVVAAAGDDAPFGPPGTTILGVGFPVINELGEVALTIDTGAAGEGLFIWTEEAGLTAIGFTGDTVERVAPSDCIADPQITDFGSTVHISDGSWLLVVTRLECQTQINTRGFRALLRADPTGVLELVAAEGDVYDVSGLPNASVQLIDESAFALASSGHAAFRATVVTSVEQDAIYRRNPNGSLRLVVATGGSAPGVGSGVTFEDIGAPGVSAAGTVFGARLVGPSIDLSNRRGVFRRLHGDGLELIAREGDAAGSTGETFASFVGYLFAPGIIDTGAGFFWAKATDTMRGFACCLDGVWRFAANGNLSLGVDDATNFGEAVGNQAGSVGGSTRLPGNLSGIAVDDGATLSKLGMSENGFGTLDNYFPQLVANDDLYFFASSTSNGASLVVRWTHEGDVETVFDASAGDDVIWGSRNTGSIQQGRNANAAGQVTVLSFPANAVIVRVPEPDAIATGTAALVVLAGFSLRRRRPTR